MGYFKRLAAKTENAAVGFVQVPNTDQYVVASREPMSGGELVGVVDIKGNWTDSWVSEDNHFCAGVGVSGKGDVYLVGGERENMQMRDGRYSIARVLLPKDTNDVGAPRVATMRYPRWYPSVCRVDDNNFLIVGGSEDADAGPTPPVAELWDTTSSTANPQRPGQTKPVPIPASFEQCMEKNHFPFLHLLPNGNMVWWGNRCGAITAGEEGNWEQLVPLQSFANSFKYNTMYPLTATISPLALDWRNKYAAGMVIFGGGGHDYYGALDKSLRMDFKPCKKKAAGYCPSKFVEEDMGQAIVMGLSTLLPNGKIILHGGAAKGFAALINPENGYNYAAEPNMRSFIYDPAAPKGRRYTEMGATRIMRLYHAVACLHHSGEVVVAGCETCARSVGGLTRDIDMNPTEPYEHRMEVIVPHFIAPGVVRPVITNRLKTFARGQRFEVRYRYNVTGGITGAAIAAPCASTHSINMGQRVIMLKTKTLEDGVVRVFGPPKNMPHLAPAGWYMLFLLGQRDTYSEGVWVQLVA